jgi:hypothetical protein
MPIVVLTCKIWFHLSVFLSKIMYTTHITGHRMCLCSMGGGGIKGSYRCVKCRVCKQPRSTGPPAWGVNGANNPSTQETIKLQNVTKIEYNSWLL